jgi:hypothetical protein
MTSAPAAFADEVVPVEAPDGTWVHADRIVRGDTSGLLVRRWVDIPTSVHGRLERQEELPKAREVGRALEYLSNRQRASLPRPLACQCRRDPGAEGADRRDPVAAGREPVGIGEEVGGRPGTSRRQRDCVTKAAPRRAHQHEHHRTDDGDARRVKQPVRNLAAPDPAEKQFEKIAEADLDPLREPIERRRRAMDRVVARHRHHLMQALLRLSGVWAAAMTQHARRRARASS